MSRVRLLRLHLSNILLLATASGLLYMFADIASIESPHWYLTPSRAVVIVLAMVICIFAIFWSIWRTIAISTAVGKLRRLS